MATDVSKIPPRILSDLKERGMSDDEIRISSVRELLDQYLHWHGICGYTSDIIRAYEAFKDAQIK